MAKRTIPPRELEQELLDRLALLNQQTTAKRSRRTRTRGRARVRLAGLMGVFALLALGASGAFAVHDEGFQLEGNATAADLHHGTVCVDTDNDNKTPCVNVPAGDLSAPFNGAYDWDSLFDIQAGAAPGNALGTVSGPKAVLPGDFTGADFQKDFKNSGTTFQTGDDSTFATGSKDTLDINPNPGGWQCNHDNNVNSKVDIINGFAATMENGDGQFFYFGLEKDVDNGDNNVGMWLFQDPTVGCSSASGTANFSGHHTVGDLLVVSAFTNGGGVSNIDVYQWNPGNGTADDPLEKLASGVDCLVTGGLDSVCATVFEPNDPTSHTQNKLTMPWLSADNSVVNASHPSPNFYEGGINLSAFPQFADECFTSYLLDTRSSQSPTATLFDYVQGSIGTCNPAMTITKVATPTDVCAGANTLVTYDYTVENTGNIDLTNVDVSDDTIPGAQAAFELANGGSDDLAVGASVSFSLTATINETTTNIVTVDADSRAGENTASDTATATVTAHDCTITVTKSNSGDVCDGGTVSYTITVTNNSDLYDWTGNVDDDVLGNLATGVTIAAGDSVTYTPSHAVTGTVTNTVTADGTFNDGSSSSASDSDSSTVSSHDCTITVTKSNSGDVCDGGTVSYTITVTNNSDLYDWTGNVDDDVLGNLATGVTIAAGDSVTYTPSHAVTGTVTNTVTADGTFNDGSSSSASDSDSSTVSSHDCTITVTKSNSGDVCDGGTVSYTITVTNNSDLYDWTGNVDDDVLGNLATGVTIAAGDSVTYTPSHAVTGTVTNTVTADGTFNDGSSSSASDSDSSTVSSHDCTITVTKSNSGDVCDGGTVSYTITVTNNSDLYDWTGNVDDDVLGNLATGVTIAAGDSVTYTPSHAVTGTVTNTVTADGTFNDGSSSSASDSDSSTVSSHDCTITVTKSNPDDVCTGGEVTYDYTITNNSGQFTWTGTLVDDQLGDVGGGSFSLDPGETKSFSANANITGTVTNIVTGSGAFDDPDTSAASDTDTATVSSHDCSITITKTPSLTQVCNGDTVSYSYTVTNNSDVFDWTGDVVDDAGTPGDPSDDVTLASNVTIAAGATNNYTLDNVVINGTVTNTVTATGAFNDPASSSASDTATATVVGQNCGGGCTPGFWQGGLGVTLWNQVNDPQWTSHGGAGTNPFVTTRVFKTFFPSSGSTSVDNSTMLQLVGTGGGSSWPRKAARDLVAAYLNASFGSLNYPYSTATILADWATAVAGGNAGFQAFHDKYSVANQLGCTIS